jgi:hypothetical protein
VPSWKHRACDACGTPVAYKDDGDSPPRLCRFCWGDPLKRAAALFGDDPEDDPPNLPVVPAEERTSWRFGSGSPGMTGMYLTPADAFLVALYAPGWLLERVALKLLCYA